ncbi:MAG: helix-turn-helix transcriptional regulator [Bacteroidales bacterium]|nr:helix-turn-helix transcriptional regulator [Bacteroidales bacterium]
MVDRINLILKAKNITPKQFAEEIGIQPSGMSHILSERNRPSLDFVMKVINRYPEIDIKWLILGEGEMYTSVSSPQQRMPVPDLFSLSESEPEVIVEENPVESATPADEVVEEPQKEEKIVEECKVEERNNAECQVVQSEKRIQKILIIYDDQTFSMIYPEKRE